MASVTPETREHDHKTWLNDIERWLYDLKVWQGHGETMRQDAHSVVTAVEQFLQEAKDHGESLAQLQHRIAECERSAMKRSESSDTLERVHREVADVQNERSRTHSRLEKKRHELMAALSAALS